MSPALHRGLKKALRTVIQLAVGGALTETVNRMADGLSPNTKVYVLAGWTVLIALLQNSLETAGKIPVLLPTPGLVPNIAPLAAKAVGTVETTIDKVGDTVGDVEGIVTDLTGGLLGEVTPPGEGE